jgi:transposase-like protein
MQGFREQKLLSYYPIIYLDATYVKTKRDRISSEAYYIELAVKPDMRFADVSYWLFLRSTDSQLWILVFEQLKAIQTLKMRFC